MAKETKAAAGGDKAKKVCPITRKQFSEGAKPLTLTIEGPGIKHPVQVVLGTKEFKGKDGNGGTLGWFANGQAVVEIDGIPTKVTFQGQVYVANSKELPK